MIIETERLIIRSIRSEDEAAFTALASDGSLIDVGFSRDCSSWMNDWISEAKALADANNPTSDYLAYVITLKGQDTAIGAIGCSYYSDLEKVGITYFIGAQYRKRGYAAEAAKAYIDYFFSHYNFTSLIATIRQDNVSSWNVVESVGFSLIEKRFYKDSNDTYAKLYRFYEIKKT